MPEEMGVHVLRDPRCDRIPFDNLAETPRRVGLRPPRFKQVHGSLGALSLDILREFPAEVGRTEARAIFVPLALVNPQVTRLQIHISYNAAGSISVRRSGNRLGRGAGPAAKRSRVCWKTFLR